MKAHGPAHVVEFFLLVDSLGAWIRHSVCIGAGRGQEVRADLFIGMPGAAGNAKPLHAGSIRQIIGALGVLRDCPVDTREIVVLNGRGNEGRQREQSALQMDHRALVRIIDAAHIIQPLAESLAQQLQFVGRLTRVIHVEICIEVVRRSVGITYGVRIQLGMAKHILDLGIRADIESGDIGKNKISCGI